MRFLDLIQKSPLPGDGVGSTELFAELAQTEAADAVQALRSSADGQEFLTGVFDGSAFLRRAARSSPACLACLLRDGPEPAFEAALAEIAVASKETNLKTAMARLRKGRMQAALTVGLADLSGAWATLEATAALSRFAATAIDASLSWIMTHGAKTAFEPDVDIRQSGFIVLGMGKLGAGELNYSSDVDLILLYDPDRLPIRRPERTQHEMTRLARTLAQLLEERTSDGYVCRTDYRLRPDPASTPPAVSIRAAEIYYESMGQNWERAAMIKARPIAGDIAAGEAFLGDLRPFIWRRSLDFNAIRDIQSIKRQIDRGQGGEPPAAFEHNVKLGRGGIREIEFFAQTQQLIWGGRDPSLRPNDTLSALKALAAAGHIEDATASELSAAYLKLRDIEHRLQMVEDRQTHTTPAEGEADAFARFAGYENASVFAADLVATLTIVEGHFSALFAEEPTLGGGGVLSFTGEDDDPETIKTIESLGFQQPARVVDAIRRWHRGRVRAARTQRAREILTELTPDLLRRFGQTPDPDRAFLAFERFVEGLPAGVQLFSLIEANRELLEFLARIFGRSAYLSDLVGRRPQVLDVVLDANFMDPDSGLTDLDGALRQELADAADLQDTLDGVRRWMNDLKLTLGVHTLEAHLAIQDAARTLSDAADLAIGAVLAAVQNDFEAAHGTVPNGAFALLAYGKWGGQELALGSDLDMVAVYDAPEGQMSDGDRPLPAPVYFIRLTQRLSTAITATTGEGRLFETDMRLRPSGSDGPVATHVEALDRYLEADAWTWELMALSRARPAIGDAGLLERIQAIRTRILSKASAHEDLLGDAARMRERIETAKRGIGVWDVRGRRGGLVDLEFVAQALAVKHGAEPSVVAARDPHLQIIALDGCGAFADLSTSIGSSSIGAALIEAARFWPAAQWMIRLVGHDPAAGEIEHLGVQETLAAALGVADYAAVIEKREATAMIVAEAFDSIFLAPA